MPSIKVLPKQLANQIAAGEVVERPSSVVKELLENAVDAKGTHILCEIKNAGKQLIRIRDNGIGIVKNELPLALAPHATSKISTAEDLNAIVTLGFRGEALASIASVSKLTLSSKTKEQEHGYCVRVEGPEQDPVVEPVAHPEGTTVDVAELFFNTPARRRFLKSDRTEFLKIKDIFTRVALAHPDIGFELISDSKSVVRVSPSKVKNGIDLRRTSTLLGADFSSGGISVICEDPAIQIEGMVLEPPKETDAVSEQIYLFLNGRPIADKLVTHALKEAFFEVIGKTLPIRCVLYFSIDPSEVDVNVHPRKDEVRFHNSSLIHDLIVDNIVLALRKYGIGPDNKLNDVSAVSHVSSFDIDSKELPSFPKGVSSFNRSDSLILKNNNFPNRESGIKNNTSDNVKNYSDYLDKVIESSAFYQDSVKSTSLANKSFVSESFSNLKTVYADNLAVLDSVADDTLLVRYRGKFFLLNINNLKRKNLSLEFSKSVISSELKTVKLTLPFTLVTDEIFVKALKNAENAVKKCGFVLKLYKTKVEIIQIPEMMKGCQLAEYAAKALKLICASFKSIEDNQIPVQLSDLMALTDSSLIDVNSVLESVDSFEPSSKDPEVMAELNFEKIIRIQRYGNEK
ncbi:MAG: DNA mismatch repair endonuclease MutL [Succinatimonas hippei]|nr:DNA mismatch repair endonuclease MutL [Succinatimonas hippei]